LREFLFRYRGEAGNTHAMPLRFMPTDVSKRTACLRAILLAGTFLGMVASTPLWLTAREYPLVPVAGWYLVIPAPWDQWFFAALLGSLAASWRFHRWGTGFFLAGTLFLYFADQNRGQPWLYMYWGLMVLTLLPEPQALAACRVALSVVYVWAGIQKCNARFFQIVPGWFVSPAAAWGGGAAILDGLKWAVAATPAIEVFIGLGLWIPRLRPWATAATIVVHGAALLFLGPLGHRYNLAIWPWNLAMVALVLALFAGLSLGGLRPIWLDLRRSRVGLTVVGLFALLPVLSFVGRWDSYFSFALYSANLATADIYITPALGERLPARMRAHVHAVQPPFDPVLQGPLVFDHQTWALTEMGAPPLPEPRGFRVMLRYVEGFSTNADEVHMIVAPRRGPITLYRRGTSSPLDVLRRPAR
jgi:hypothetical protein